MVFFVPIVRLRARIRFLVGSSVFGRHDPTLSLVGWPREPIIVGRPALLTGAASIATSFVACTFLGRRLFITTKQ